MESNFEALKEKVIRELRQAEKILDLLDYGVLLDIDECVEDDRLHHDHLVHQLLLEKLRDHLMEACTFP